MLESRSARHGRVWIIGLTAIAAMYAALRFGPVLEAEHWPVAGGFELIERGVSPDGFPTFRLRMEIYRPECAYSHMYWYGIREDGTRDPSALRSGFQPNVDGSWPPYEAAVPADEPDILGEARYRCPLEPWLTKVTIGPFPNWTYAGDRGSSR